MGGVLHGEEVLYTVQGDSYMVRGDPCILGRAGEGVQKLTSSDSYSHSAQALTT